MPAAGLWVSIRNYVLLGAMTALALSLIELVDVQIQLTPVFASFRERLILAAYTGLNVFIGAIIGLLIGLFVSLTSFLKDRLARLLSRGNPSLPLELGAGLFIFVLAAILLKQ